MTVLFVTVFFCFGLTTIEVAAPGVPDCAAGDHDVVARHVATFGIAAVDFADRAAGDRGGVARRGASSGIATVDIDIIERAGQHVHLIVFYIAAPGLAAVDITLLNRAASDEYMVLREDICPPE